jgi:hypothetical protein
MNTTLIFAELLIIGLEGGIWLSFLLLSYFGVGSFDKFLIIVKDWQLFILAIILPLLYVIGVIIDRTADGLFKVRERKIEREIIGDLDVSPSVMRFSLGVQNEILNQQLEYSRTRMRIVRASSINFLLIAVSISIFLLTRIRNLQPNVLWGYIGFTLILGLVFAYSAFLSWQSLIRGHLKLAKAMYDYQNPRSSRKKILKKN